MGDELITVADASAGPAAPARSMAVDCATVTETVGVAHGWSGRRQTLSPKDCRNTARSNAAF